MRPPILLLLLPLALTPLAAAQDEFMIHMAEFEYLPDPMHVPPGAEVVAMNFDQEPHTITSSTDRSLFDLREIPPGGEARYFDAPTQPGEYPYYCIYHGAADGTGMAGLLVVDAAATPTGPAMTPTPEATPAPTSASPPVEPDETPLPAWLALSAVAAAGALLRRR